VDWNEDGTADLITGSRDGRVMYFQGSPSEAAPVLSFIGYISSSGSEIFVGANSAPFVTDWNGDGLHDLLMGAENKEMGSVPKSTRIYINNGSTGNPLFTGYSQLYCSGSPIIPHRCVPWVTDLSGDGKKDLIWGVMEGCFLYFENTGTNDNPVFSLEDTLRYSNGSVIEEGTDSRPVITDWNDDGVLDLITGYADGTVMLHLGQQTGLEEGFCPVPPRDQVTVLNPVRGSIRVFLDLAEPDEVAVSVYDTAGRVVGTGSQAALPAGSHQLLLDVSAFPSGVYAVRVLVSGFTTTHPVVLLR
jgi:hypothetical protein